MNLVYEWSAKKRPPSCLTKLQRLATSWMWKLTLKTSQLVTYFLEIDLELTKNLFHLLKHAGRKNLISKSTLDLPWSNNARWRSKFFISKSIIFDAKLNALFSEAPVQEGISIKIHLDQQWIHICPKVRNRSSRMNNKSRGADKTKIRVTFKFRIRYQIRSTGQVQMFPMCPPGDIKFVQH